ncbi:MAG: hypothetical protein ABIA47_02275 [bacterium]
MANYFDQQISEWRSSARRFWHDWKKLWRASQLTAVSIFASQAILGLASVLTLWFAGSLVDALVGARGISVFTSDVEKWFWCLVVLWALTIISILFTRQLKGFTDHVGRQTRLAILATSLLIAALPAGPIRVGLIVAVLIASKLIKIKYAHSIMSAIIIVISLQVSYDLIYLTVHKGISIGDMLAWAGSLTLLSGWAVISPTLKVQKP